MHNDEFTICVCASARARARARVGNGSGSTYVQHSLHVFLRHALRQLANVQRDGLRTAWAANISDRE